MKKKLLGKNISYFDSFSGSHYNFCIAWVEEFEDSVHVKPQQEDHWGVYIRKPILHELVTVGTVTKYFTIEGCSCREKWTIYRPR